MSLGFASIVTLIVGLTAPLWSAQLGFGRLSPLVVATVLWTAPGAGVQVMLALLLAQDRLRSFAVVSILSAVGGQVFGIALLLAVHRNASTYAWGGVISQFGAMGIGILLTRPVLSGLVDRPVASRAFKLGVSLALGGLAFFVLNAGDRIIIQRLLGSVEVGRYQVAYTVGYVVVLLLTFTSQAWAPRFAAARDEVHRVALLASSRDEVYRLLLPMILGVTLIAPVGLRIVAPSSFRPESLLIVVFLVALSAFPVAASGASGRALISRRRTRPLALATGVAAAANMALNFALVPVFGIAGSAAATVLACALMALLQARVVPSEPAWPRTPPTLWLAIALTGSAGAISVLLPQTPLWSGGRFVVAAAVCLPWFVLRLRTARRAGDPRVEPVPVGAVGRHRADVSRRSGGS